MTGATYLILGVFVTVVFLYALASVALFYHIERYSYIGDASKKAFLTYIVSGIVVSVVAIILIIINHLVF